MKTNSPTGKLLWLLPPAAALFYPLAVRALYESGKLLHRTNGPREAIAWLAIAVSAGLVYSVPALGITVAYVLGCREKTSSSELLARRVAHMAVAAPPLLVLIGVVFYLRHSAKRRLRILVDLVAHRSSGKRMGHVYRETRNAGFIYLRTPSR